MGQVLPTSAERGWQHPSYYTPASTVDPGTGMYTSGSMAGSRATYNTPMRGYTTTFPTPGYAEAQQKGLTDYIAMAQKQADAARAANLQRYSQIQGIYDEIIGRYQPGGGFMAGAEAGLEQQKGRDVASEVAQTISSGLYGTTVPATAAKRWEMDVGAPQRLKLEDIRTQALSQAQIGKAGAIERREDVYPDYNLIAQMISQAGTQQGKIQTGFGTMTREEYDTLLKTGKQPGY